MINRGGGRHTYQMIAWAIREKIQNGDLVPGDTIPSLPAIQKDYGTSNPTAQKAVGLLKAWGLVRSESGRGTFVLEQRPIINLMTEMTLPGEDGKRRTWKELVAEHGQVGDQRFDGVGHSIPPADIADALDADGEEPTLWRRRLLLIDGSPVQISTSWYPADIAELIPELAEPRKLAANSMALLDRAGRPIVPGGNYDLVFACAASEEEATTLGIELGAPVTETLRTARDAEQRVVTVERMISNSARYRQAWVS